MENPVEMKLLNLISEALTKDTLTDVVLRTIEPLIEKIIIRMETKFPDENNGRSMTEYDKEMVRLTLIYDMLRSIEVYTSPTDVLIDMNARQSSKGSLTIDAVIERSGVKYHFETDAIYAGGYNIQKLHFRYLTKTRLPKTGNQNQANQVKVKMQKLSKYEAMTRDIQTFENRIKDYEVKIAAIKKMSDQDILNQDEHWAVIGKTTWVDVVQNGSVKNYGNDENTFNQSQAEYRQSLIDSKRSWIVNHNNSINGLRKTIARLQAKLNAL